MKSLLVQLADRGILPDPLIRAGMRSLLGKRREAASQGPATQAFLDDLRDAPLAVATADANEQHYEVPTRFFMEVLGPRLKYSSCYWPEGVETLKDAESAMLDLTCLRAELDNGMDILELGCGWGSLTLWMAQRYPGSRILAVSNSSTQRAHIETQALDLGLCNVEVVTCDMNDFDTDRRFDRIVSVEMFEHMRNHRLLMDRAAEWLRPEGKLFVHIFAHQGNPYLFEDSGNPDDWMSKYFFTGGMMPSVDLLPLASDALKCEEKWEVNGIHYSRTLEAWLQRQDAAKDDVMALFQKAYGPGEAARWFQRWRMFWMACSELFRYNGGRTWPVMHYRFVRAA